LGFRVDLLPVLPRDEALDVEVVDHAVPRGRHRVVQHLRVLQV